MMLLLLLMLLMVVMLKVLRLLRWRRSQWTCGNAQTFNALTMSRRITTFTTVVRVATVSWIISGRVV